MLNILIHRLIPEYETPTLPHVRNAYGTLCGCYGIFLNLLLFAGKLAAGLLSGSIAVTADAFNNLSDAGSSLITLIGFRLAGHKPDPHHPFGHGRIEYLSGLLVAGFILLMAYELLSSSILQLFQPRETHFSPVLLLILFVSILIKLYMWHYNRTIGRRIRSSAMEATGVDSLGDALATSVVLVSALVRYFFDISLDAWCGIAIALFILVSGVQAARDTINPLLGQPPEASFVDEIKALVLDNPRVLGMHDLIVHNYGPGRIMISLHAEVPADSDILEIHDLIDNIENKLAATLHCEAVIHMDPIVTDDEEALYWRGQLSSILERIHPSLQFHDFRMVRGNTHNNLIFDLVVPYHFHLKDEELQTLIQSAVHDVSPVHFTVIQFDRDFTVPVG